RHAAWPDEVTRRLAQPLPSYVLPPLDPAHAAAPHGGGPLEVGLVRGIDLSADRDGEWALLPDGRATWTLQLRATGARGVRLRLHGWRSGMTLYLESLSGQERRRIGSSHPSLEGEVWTPIIFEDEVRLCVVMEGAAPPSLRITGVGHLHTVPQGGGVGTPALCCHRDVNCYPAWQDEADGVAAVWAVNDGSLTFCSGFMLTRAGGAMDFTPLFATATHCGVTGSNVHTVSVGWGFESRPGVGGTTPCNSGTELNPAAGTLDCTNDCNFCSGAPVGWANVDQTPAAVRLVRDLDTDWTLLGLVLDKDFLPSTDVEFLGWNAGTMSNGASATCIHHPAGDFKRVSFGQKANNNGDNASAGCTNADFYRIDWNVGLTQPGSSGSPLLGASGSVRGLLSCTACELNGMGNCDVHCNLNNPRGDYGRLDEVYPLVQPYLDPPNPVYVHSSANDGAGTPGNPFGNVYRGLYSVIEGGTVYIDADAYGESWVCDKAMLLTVTTPGSGSAVIGN
ncbi:MAG: hypothetical protein KDA25_04480, partial [Phycisphaerales bacterium]|nr:hypothetical protein [Phycisphaerales bacterium]